MLTNQIFTQNIFKNLLKISFKKIVKFNWKKTIFNLSNHFCLSFQKILPKRSIFCSNFMDFSLEQLQNNQTSKSFINLPVNSGLSEIFITENFSKKFLDAWTKNHNLNHFVLQFLLGMIITRLLEIGLSWILKKKEEFFLRFEKIVEKNDLDHLGSRCSESIQKSKYFKYLWRIYKKYFYFLSFEKFLFYFYNLVSAIFLIFFLYVFYYFICLINFKDFKLLLKSIDFKSLKFFFKFRKKKHLECFFSSFNISQKKFDLFFNEIFTKYLSTTCLANELRAQLLEIAKKFGTKSAIKLEIILKIFQQIEDMPFVEILYSQEAKNRALKLSQILNLKKTSKLGVILKKDHIRRILKMEKKHIKMLKKFQNFLRYYFSLILKKKIWNIND